MVAPGLLRNMLVAKIPVVVEPESPRPSSSVTNTRSASPSKAKPISNPPEETRACKSRWFAACKGSAG
ncbi:unannotated protein [freshwater metagenome]|uniref:Unannotated protein n=1 Tax=freshwater metagenome TaxID=449393 RepID=A0A6J7QIW0_9ZZZZ